MTIEEIKILITTETSEAAKQISKVRDEMKGLLESAKTTTEKVKDSFSNMANNIKSMGIGNTLKTSMKAAFSAVKNGVSNLSGMSDGFKRIKEHLGGLTKSAKVAGAGLKNIFANMVTGIKSLGIGQALQNCMKSAIGVIENENTFDSVMGQWSKSVRTWSNELQKDLGLNAFEVRKNVGVLYGMSLSMGVSEQSAVDMSKQLTELAYNMAGLYNLPSEEVFDKLKEGISGDVGPLKDLNISISENTIKQLAYKKGIAEVGSELNQQQRILSTYMAIMDQTKNVQGELARTMDNPANQIRFLSTQLNAIKINIGQAFLPIMQVVVPVLAELSRWLLDVTNTIAQFSNALFGMGNVQAKQSSTTSETIAHQKTLGKVTEDTGKKAKGSVAGFDEINSIQLPTAKSNTGSEGKSTEMPTADSSSENGSGDNGDIEIPFKDKIEEMKTVFEPLKQSLESFKQAFEPVLQGIGDGLSKLWTEVLQPVGSWTVSEALPSFLDLVSGAIEVLTPLIEAFKPLGEWLWNNLLKPLAEFTADTFTETCETVTEKLESIGTWMAENQGLVNAIALAIAGFFAAWEITKLLAFVEMSGGLVGALSIIAEAIVGCTVAKLADKLETIALTTMYAKDFIMNLLKTVGQLAINTGSWLANTAAKAANTVAGWASVAAQTAYNVACTIGTAVTSAFGVAMSILTSPVTLVIAAIGLLVAGVYLLITHWDEVKEVASICWEKIKEIWGVCAEWLNKNVITPVVNFFKGLWNSLCNGIKSVYDAIKGIFKGVIEFVTGTFIGAWKKAWGLVKEIFSGVWDSFASIAKAPINLIISSLNFLIRKMNKISISIPSWVPKIGGKSFGVNIPQIPELARGGIVDEPTIAKIGEAGKEMVIPLENTSFVTTLASSLGNAVMDAIQISTFGEQKNNAEDKNVEVILEVDATELGRVLVPKIEEDKQRTGLTILETV